MEIEIILGGCWVKGTFAKTLNEGGRGPWPVVPYMGFNLIPLSVIPEIRITDKGLVTVPRMQILPLFELAASA